MSQRAHRSIPISIGEQYTEENIKSTKHILWKRQRVFDKQLTTDSYQDSLIFDARLYKRKLFQIINKHASNSILYKILGCIDPNDTWETLQAETTLTAGNSATHSLTDPWAYVKIQIKSASAGNAGKVTAYISGMTP